MNNLSGEFRYSLLFSFGLPMIRMSSLLRGAIERLESLGKAFCSGICSQAMANYSSPSCRI